MMRQLSLLGQLYVRPFAAMSALLDEGSWIFSAVLVVLFTAVLQYHLVAKQPFAQPAPVRQHAPHAPVDVDEMEASGAAQTSGVERQAWRMLSNDRFSVF